jgi:hypothetical protein
MSWSRTIAGISTTTDAERQTFGHSGVTIGSARPASIKTTARRSLTSCSGSNVAFKSRTRLTLAVQPVGPTPTWRPQPSTPD